ncbi:MAG: PAS domain S-box protein [Nitrospirae bacterium]|nr:PAS domain S-box protein [Nitrospirota bacterium]
MGKLKILIVEDNAVIAKDLQWQLEDLGYIVPSIAATGNDAISKVKENKIDLVLMDIILAGEMDGIETADQMRTKHRVPVIYLTAYADDATLKRAKITEPYGYLVKPVSNIEMRSSIEMAIYKFNMERELRESEEKYSLLVEKAKDGVFIIKEGVYKYVNRAMTDIVGYSVEELLGMKVMDTIAPEFRPLIAERYKARMEGKRVHSTYEFKTLCKRGETKDVELSAGLIQYKGEPAFMGIIRDITERKNTEDELNKHRERLAGLVEERTSELTATNELLREEIRERKLLEKAILETEDREMQRIGYELHDVLGQLLTGLSLKSQNLENILQEKLMPEAELASRITFLIDKAKEHLRFMMQGSLPMENDQDNIVLSLEGLASRITRDFNVPCFFKSSGFVTMKNKTGVLHLYRIAQEAITNAVRHGKPARIDIGLSRKKNIVKLTVKDDGTGISDGRKQKNGLGLKIMNFRANMINAELNIQSEINMGTSITCTFIDNSREDDLKKVPE